MLHRLPGDDPVRPRAAAVAAALRRRLAGGGHLAGRELRRHRLAGGMSEPRIVDAEMRAYYDRRAREYDDWWLGDGRFADVDRPGWRDEVQALIDVVAGLPPARVLDVACGTGFLTQHLRGEVVGLDQSPAMVEVAGARLPRGHRCSRATRCRCRSPTASSTACSPVTSTVTCCRTSAPPSSPRRGGSPASWSWSTRRCVDGRGRRAMAAAGAQRRVEHRVYKRYFVACDLADELGGGDVLHAGTWFVAVIRCLAPLFAILSVHVSSGRFRG